VGIASDDDTDAALADGDHNEPKPAQGSLESSVQEKKAAKWVSEATFELSKLEAVAEVAEFENKNKAIVKSLDTRFPDVAKEYHAIVMERLNQIRPAEEGQ
jgi:hypothetical protein